MTLVITDGEFWWSWRELNPCPNFYNFMNYIKYIDMAFHTAPLRSFFSNLVVLIHAKDRLASGVEDSFISWSSIADKPSSTLSKRGLP